MKSPILLLLILVQTIFTYGQKTKDENELISLLKLDLGLQGIGFTFEPRLSKKITMDLSLGAGGGYDVWEGGVDYQWNILHPAFYFSITPKYFYNRQKRIDKGKTTRLNAGNYIGFRIKYASSDAVTTNDALRDALLINFHWGLQRAIGNHWTFNVHAGAGYAQDLTSEFGTVYPALDVKFSYIF